MQLRSDANSFKKLPQAPHPKNDSVHSFIRPPHDNSGLRAKIDGFSIPQSCGFDRVLYDISGLYSQGISKTSFDAFDLAAGKLIDREWSEFIFAKNGIVEVQLTSTSMGTLNFAAVVIVSRIRFPMSSASF